MIIFLIITGIFCTFISFICFTIGIYLNLADRDAGRPVGYGTTFLIIGLILLFLPSLTFRNLAVSEMSNLNLIRLVFSFLSKYFSGASWVYLIVTLLIVIGGIKEGKAKKRTSLGSLGRFAGLSLLAVFFYGVVSLLFT